jgi:hypothetical protein
VQCSGALLFAVHLIAIRDARVGALCSGRVRPDVAGVFTPMSWPGLGCPFRPSVVKSKLAVACFGFMLCFCTDLEALSPDPTMPLLLPSEKCPKCNGPMKRQPTLVGTLFVCEKCDTDDPIKAAEKWIEGELRPPD